MISVLLLNQLVEIAAIALTPILIIYALIAYKGEYESRSLPSLIALALIIGLSTFFDVWSDSGAGSTAVLLHHFLMLLAMIVLFFILRSYVHLSLELLKKGKLVPRAVKRYHDHNHNHRQPKARK